MNKACMVFALAVGLLFLGQAKAEESLSQNSKILEMHKVSQKIRRDQELPEQTLDEECCQIAQRWANYMAENRRFQHGGGEQIIAYGYHTPEGAFDGWMNSSGHRHWLLSNTKMCGWGCQKSKSGEWYWVGVFRNSHVPSSLVIRNNGRRILWWRKGRR